MASEAPLSPEDTALLDRLADRLVEMRMETPAILALETGKPMSVIAAQAMVFFEPFVQAVVPVRDYRRWARLLERRDAIETLIRRIEERAAARGGRGPAPGSPRP